MSVDEDGSRFAIFVGNLAWSTTNESLRVFGERIAVSTSDVKDAVVQKFSDDRRSKGWG